MAESSPRETETQGSSPGQGARGAGTAKGARHLKKSGSDRQRDRARRRSSTTVYDRRRLQFAELMGFHVLMIGDLGNYSEFNQTEHKFLFSFNIVIRN
jgi:hypothetical protein